MKSFRVRLNSSSPRQIPYDKEDMYGMMIGLKKKINEMEKEN